MRPPAAAAPPALAVIGAGPAGLMAAEIASQGGVSVDVYDAMPSVGRKLLMAGKGGLNITHSEPDEQFRSRYGARQTQVTPWLEAFGPNALRAWMHGLGVASFVGSSGRVFPTEMKAAPLLRAWLQRLRAGGVRFHVRHRWTAWTRLPDGHTRLGFSTPHGDRQHDSAALVLALGGGSWARLGSDGRWQPLLADAGVALAPLRPSNCGFDIAWSEHLRQRFAGQPIKSVGASCVDAAGVGHRRRGEFLLTANGVEGGLIYALSAALRDAIDGNGSATLHVDLLPEHEMARVVAELARPRGARSLASHLQSRLRLKGAKVALLRECTAADDFLDAGRLGAAIKSVPLRLLGTRPIDEAISTAGGVCFDALDEQLMLRNLPGVFCAGEMLDWEAPTGGYLLTACLASGHAAGRGALAWLRESQGQRVGTSAPAHWDDDHE
ncbi:TIGR03862 family flavoprotein [Candidatus Accumulibacter sp. ACC003]|uniref:TIGR03862 family flavoprotein n=1 Tax=Candidatus Accumulibacter sp. ACC003 TaxID=2823334 RepID=UPI0025BB66EE|nr:TIGR03862 family flavoprotein [Candidatus Accumulibacter sp. ACC003]